MDDNAMGDNEEYMIDKEKEYRDSDEFTSIAMVRIQVPDSAIDKILFPASGVINGKLL